LEQISIRIIKSVELEIYFGEVRDKIFSGMDRMVEKGERKGKKVCTVISSLSQNNWRGNQGVFGEK
jgi:hypothetical protein